MGLLFRWFKEEMQRILVDNFDAFKMIEKE